MSVKKDRSLFVRVSKGEMRMAKQAAAKAGLTVSEMIRQSIRTAFEDVALNEPLPEKKEGK